MTHSVATIDLNDASQLEACFEVFCVLRPHLDRDEFIQRVQRQTAEGYSIIAAQKNGITGAVAGFRIAHFLAWGKVLYIDDLATHPKHLRQGYAGTLLDWLTEKARQQGCNQIHLDTGHQRVDAHRLYLNKGFTLSSHHMSKIL